MTLNACDIEDTCKPWLACARMHEVLELAVLCATCAPPAVVQNARSQVQPGAWEGTEQAQME